MTLETREWHLDIDGCINRFLPPKFTHIFPRPIAHLLGHREKPQQKTGNVLVAIWALLGGFTGLVVIEATFMIPEIREHKPPILIASFGAAAVLQYNAIDSACAQPRCCILGHILATIIGIGITKVFQVHPHFESIRWLAGSLSCGVASAAMALTGTVYPPAGATALLAAIDPQVEQLGWYLLPLVLLSSALILVTALLFNNVQRQFPVYWWTPDDLPSSRRRKMKREDKERDAQVTLTEEERKDPEKQLSVSECSGGSGSIRTMVEQSQQQEQRETTTESEIQLTADGLKIPPQLSLTDEEKKVLDRLQLRLQQKATAETT